ncbi:hypothetical protein HK413_02270 [Mucilaginibacter sp. S1162]|uniref:Membrane fusion protein biotin-lipoyl like domain-containing protein n=1 Tax=Mucilaginibacter humi TaxID=2732510 RepID=A0ABX1W133_9SPHI|nr:hypothetical protein [Mucilaginibacter humi]NNU33288.1 hypothetical protein [Mucilaginibacter humi]
MTNETTIPHISQRTEEVQDIIDRMPTKFGILISAFALTPGILIFAIGWLIKYPDVVTGVIVINANSSPVRLVANANGKLLLNKVHSQSFVHEGDYIAIIQNSAKLEDIVSVHKLVMDFNLNALNTIVKFPKSVSWAILTQSILLL